MTEKNVFPVVYKKIIGVIISGKLYRVACASRNETELKNSYPTFLCDAGRYIKIRSQYHDVCN